LYKINAAAGERIKKIKLLEEGETRPITNDYSVLNLAFSGDGQYFVATITPRAYLLRSDADAVIYTCTPTSNLTSMIAFSPDNRFFATSDIRASKPIKIWPMPEEK
jgi:WD40 repeat protein